MSNIWGPMGWMTLHSIASSYPDVPSPSDKAILNEYMNAFALTIPCHICNQHFSELFGKYKHGIPTWDNSKRDLFIAICRMHNNVNTRLDKPRANTLAQAIEWLGTATSYTPQRDFKNNYISYLYGQFKSGNFSQLSNVSKMKKITEEYWNIREVSYSTLSFAEDDILSFRNEPLVRRPIFSKMSLKTVRFNPRPN